MLDTCNCCSRNQQTASANYTPKTTYDNLKLITTYYNYSICKYMQIPTATPSNYLVQTSCLAAISGVDEALTRASDFIDLRLKLGSCQRSEIVQHVYCISSHWTRVAESSWDVDRAVRACIETTRSIALVGNSSVACREAAHQLKLGQYLVTTIVQLACHEVAGTLNKHNVQTCRWHHH
jgi:hypothetical protein